MANKDRPNKDTIFRNRPPCFHGRCKTLGQGKPDPDIFFIIFPKPCPIYTNNRIATILDQPITNEHTPHNCLKCSKALRWIDLCSRFSDPLQGLDKVIKSTYICSKHFINPDRVGRQPNADHPDPISAKLTEKQIQELLKNLKRKEPTESSAVISTKKTRTAEEVSKDTSPNRLNEVSDNLPQNVNRINKDSQILPTPEQEQDKGPCSSSNANSIDEIKKLPSKSPLILKRKKLCNLQNVNSHIENSNSPGAHKSHHLKSVPSNVKKITSSSTQIKTKDNLQALVAECTKLKWFTNLDGETASFLKLSEDNLPLFTVKVSDNKDNTFVYELFMFNQCTPTETSEKVLLEEVEVKLKQLFRANVCRGVISDQVKNYFTAHQGFTSATLCHITGGLRSINCRLFSDNGICLSCRNVGKRISHLIKCESERKEPHKFTSNKSMNDELLRKKLIESAKIIKVARKKIVRYQKAIESLKKKEKETQEFNFPSIFYEDD